MAKQIIINKEKAIKLIKIKCIIGFIIGTLIWYIIIGFGWILFEMRDDITWHSIQLLFIIPIMLFFEAFIFWYNKRFISTLEQEYDKNQLTTKYSIITKHNENAKIQVVNNINITQGLLDKLFNFFNIEVDYGFGENGYTHIFNYLTEEQAEEISKQIKHHQRLEVNLR